MEEPEKEAPSSGEEAAPAPPPAVSGGSGSGSEHSSDTESWTLIDEEDEEEAARDDNGAATATTATDVESAESRVHELQPEPEEGAQRPASSSSSPMPEKGDDADGGVEQEGAALLLSDVLPTLPSFQQRDDGPESLCSSDGIPIAEDLSEERPKYLWNPMPDGGGDRSSGDDGGEEDSPIDDDDDDVTSEDDIEIIPPPTPPRANDLTTHYPPEELPYGYAEITKGHTYSHRRNQQVNLVLSGALIVFVALAVGLGVGHFLGWSERLELQELYAEVREEKMEELTDSLVTCMTGEEGKGGDDQDLDDRVIQQLWDENKELKEQLEMLKTRQADTPDRKVEEELSVILRDRINDLLVANADLEREVSRLRYSHLQVPKSDLVEAKAELNEVITENDQLRLAVARARYSRPPAEQQQQQDVPPLATDSPTDAPTTPAEAAVPAGPAEGIVEIKTLVSDTDAELKAEIPAAPPAQPVHLMEVIIPPTAPATAILVQQEANATAEDPAVASEDEGFVEIEEDPAPSEPVEDFTGFSHEFLLGKEDAWQPTEEPKEEEPAVIEPQEEEELAQDESVSPVTFFKSLSDAIAASPSGILFTTEDDLDSKSAFETVEKIRKKIVDSVPSGDYIESGIHDLLADAEHFLVDKLHELERLSRSWPDSKTSSKAVGKLGKTVFKALKKVKKSLKKKKFGLGDSWSKIRGEMVGKWDHLLDKFVRKILKEEHRRDVAPKASEEDKDYTPWSSPAVADEDDVVAAFTQWTFETIVDGSNNASSSSWVFGRAQTRKEARDAAGRSDWFFDRARDREHLHEFADADWHSKRFFNKKCSDDGDCEDVGELNSAGTNHGSGGKRIKEFREAIRRRKGDDEDDDDEDDDEFWVNRHRQDGHDDRLRGDPLFEPDFFPAYGSSRHRDGSSEFFDFDDDADDEDDDEEEDGFLRSIPEFIMKGQAWSSGAHLGPHADPRGGGSGGGRWHKSKRQERRGRYHHGKNGHQHRRHFHQQHFFAHPKFR